VADGPAELYLELLKRELLDVVHPHTLARVHPVTGGAIQVAKTAAVRAFNGIAGRRGLCLARERPFDAAERHEGRDRPITAETMIGRRRLDQLHDCIRDVLRSRTPGDFAECGVWRGGAVIFMRGALEAYADSDRQVWVADSFEGLPRPDPRNYPADAGDVHHLARGLAVSLEEVTANFERYGLLDDRVRFLPGWFKDTLPTAGIAKLAILRADGDMYESTMQILAHLYPKLSGGGYCIVDDYGAVEGCRRATDDFRAAHGITELLRPIDWTGVFWQRGPMPPS
jgi:O-methyltransferase